MSRNTEISIVSTPDQENPFECADIKTEPSDDLIPEPDIAFPHILSHSTAEVAVQTTRCKVMNRSIQVDLQLVPKEAMENTHSGSYVEGPLGPLLAKEAFEKQCRICLRQLPGQSLAYIMFPQKTKILATLGIKVYLGDAYPFICRTCSKLVDMMYEFRNTCQRARNLLANHRKAVPGQSWDSEENLRIIESCRNLLESHRLVIDAAYEASKADISNHEGKDKTESTGMIMTRPEEEPESDLDGTGLSTNEMESNSNSRMLSMKVEPVLTDRSYSPTENYDEENEFKSSTDEDAEDIYEPSSSPPPKKKRIRIVTKPYKKRQKKEKNLDKSDDSTMDDGHYKKRRKTTKDPNRARRGALCDFCGEWVEYHTVESHQNQHLGLKPYACQMAGCNMSFYCRNLLMKHIRRQHNADGPEYQFCDICKQRIKGPKAALTKHQRIHTEEKNYVCAVCGKGFTTPGYLRQHSNIHTDLMPYECSVCYRKFNNKYNMLTHEKKHITKGEVMGVGNPSSVPLEANSNASINVPSFMEYPVAQ